MDDVPVVLKFIAGILLAISYFTLSPAHLLRRLIFKTPLHHEPSNFFALLLIMSFDVISWLLVLCVSLIILGKVFF